MLDQKLLEKFKKTHTHGIKRYFDSDDFRVCLFLKRPCQQLQKISWEIRSCLLVEVNHFVPTWKT